MNAPQTIKLVLALAAALPCCYATTEYVNLTPFVNADLTRYTRGAAYPQHGGYVRINDVIFELAANPVTGQTGVIQSFSDPAVLPTWNKVTPYAAPEKHGYFNLIPIHRKNVDSVYILMNSAYGNCGARIGDLTFLNGAGEKFVYRLREGINIRDHNSGDYCNSLKTFAGVANFGNVRLDFQRIDLPPGFAFSLDLIVLHGYTRSATSGAPFIAAITLRLHQEVTSSTIHYGDVVLDKSSTDYCLHDAKSQYCTPVNSSVTQIDPDRYRVILPAHLVFGAAIPNPDHRPVHIEMESGQVCLKTPSSETTCFDAKQKAPPAGPGYLNPAAHPGALISVTSGANTEFSVNGRFDDEVSIPGSTARLFRGYEGAITFIATISGQ